MADGYVTQTRVLNPGQIPKDPSVYDTSPFCIFNGGAPTNVLTDLRTSQTTTSYRTGLLDVSSLMTGQDQVRFLMGDYSYGNRVGAVDFGHTFSTSRTLKTRSTYRTFSRSIGGKTYAFAGHLSPSGTMTLPTTPSFDETTYGNRFIVQSSPTLPRTNLMQAFAELAREGLASVPGLLYLDFLKNKSSFFRNLGGEYLNIEFGWKPFVSSILDLIKAVSNANQSLIAFENGSGRVQVRSRSTPVSTTYATFPQTGGTVNVGTNSVNIGGAAWNAIYQGGDTGRSGSSTLHQWTSQDVRFKGAFTYLLSPGKSLMERIVRYEQLANHLLGIRLTPSVLWELTPWSWLIDWFVDIQSAIQTSELLATDGLVLKYGYMTRKFIRGVSRTSVVQFLGEQPSYITGSTLEITKIRYRATPFGFGLNPNSFTNSQWAILAALGLTKAPRSLF